MHVLEALLSYEPKMLPLLVGGGIGAVLSWIINVYVRKTLHGR